jgi:ATP-dependent DNA ligase
LGAILIGYFRGKDLIFAGRVGTGFDDDTLRRLHRRLARKERKTSPFKEAQIASGGKIHWATPRLVCEIGFTEWTPNGKLRHPRYLGLRRDKDPAGVIREDQ